jgi:hypothetical protein
MYWLNIYFYPISKIRPSFLENNPEYNGGSKESVGQQELSLAIFSPSTQQSMPIWQVMEGMQYNYKVSTIQVKQKS